jgi:choline dehydrogenase
MWITSPSVFDKPQIDPGYMTHPQDVVVMREGMKLARKIGKAAGLGEVAGDEIVPGPNVQSDEDWENWVRGNTYTEYHPSGACALLPQSLGGVVDGRLTVYGTDNLRVVDSSVFTVPFSAHLMAPTFGLAEAAADMIRAQYNLPPPSASSAAPSGSKTGSAEPANATGNTHSSDDHSAAPARFAVSSASGLFVAVAALAAYIL